MLQPEPRLAWNRQHRRTDRPDNPGPRRRNSLIWDRRAFKDRILQIVIPPLRYFQPRVLVDGVQLVALPPGRDFPQVPDVVADRRRKEITPAHPGADRDSGALKFCDRPHIEIKQASEALPGYAFSHAA
jgi:hypothetical protein